MQIATLGAGCFWCVEAVFQEMNGVEKVVSGYMGGETPNPTYEMICTGRTGHAEVVQITFDPEEATFTDILEVFWKSHDPTTLNQQGADLGTQYRSVVFYHDESQREVAENLKQQLDESGAFANPIVTEISAAEQFYHGEDYHQNYFKLNEHKNPYCRMIRMKVDKFAEVFPDKVKK